MSTGSLTERLRALRRTALFHSLSWLGERRGRILAWRAMQAAGVSTVTFSRNGLNWRVPAGDSHIGFGLFVEGGFAQDTIDSLLAWLYAQGRKPGPGDVIVDVGANIGTTCIPMVRACGCRAVAIEPIPAIFTLLCENVELNGLAGRFALVEAAVTSSPGHVSMELGSDIGGATLVSESRNSPGRPVGADLIDARGETLANLLTGAGVQPSDVALVWADVQGSETAVIETGAALWSRGVPLFAEFEPGLLAQHGGVAAFYEAASRHFERFVEARRLLCDGVGATPQDISRLSDVLAREPLQTDILLLPASFRSFSTDPRVG